MGTVTWCRIDELLTAIVPRLERCQVVLDIGCGINPQNYIRPLVHICCEPFQQYVEKLQEHTAHNRDRSYIFVKATWLEVTRLFPPKSVDTIFLVDVIEHLDKVEGIGLLAATERIARQQVVIFTPLGFMPQYHPDGKDAWGLDGASWQEHRSGWLPEDFGPTWDILACRDFHRADNLGRLLDNPFGAFWAIKTFPREGRGKHQYSSLVKYRSTVYDLFRRQSGRLRRALRAGWRK